MSENENQPPTPSKQTSSVPLKKETVRVTLKAADAPPAVPSSTVPAAPAARPPAPSAPPTAAPRPPAAGAPPAAAPRPPAPAPTIPLRTAGAPTAPGAAPAPTIRLATSAAPIGSPAKPGAPAPGGAPTLPKATVQLQAPTQPLGASTPLASQPATLQIEDEEEEDANEGVVTILAGVGLAAALLILAFQFMVANTWINGDPDNNPRNGEWSQLF